MFFVPNVFGQNQRHESQKFKNLKLEGPLHGITLGLHSQDYFYDYSEMLSEISQTETQWLSLCIKFHQDKVDSKSINLYEDRPEFWTQLENSISKAKELNLKIMLFPIVLIRDPDDGDWRGVLKPKDREAWWEDYREMIDKICHLGAKYEVDIISIGSELNSMEKDQDQWEQIIYSARETFDGALTYSINWDALSEKPFFYLLDMIGLNAYFSLTEKIDPDLGELISAWNCVKEDLKQVELLQKMPFIFTEVGYTAQDGINTNPWNYMISEEVDLEEQRDCFVAFTETWIQDPFLEGAFFYDWFNYKDDCGLSYTFKDRPALEVIKMWFKEY